jgi:transposase, IS5 family
MQDINEMICQVEKERKPDDSDEPPPTASGSSGGKTGNPKENKGKLILDATCAPADIRYPTDISLLNEAREKLEAIIDVLYLPLQGVMTKPRTYRETAHREYLRFAKQRKPRKKLIRKALRKQLGYVSRDLKHVGTLLGLSPIPLTNRQKEQLAVIGELYRQQQHMYDQKTHQVEDRIVSISQPHVRPIVRGKANASTEFGAKVAISLVNGYSFIEKLSWNNFNEGNTLQEAAETFKQRNGHYPEAIFADAIYRNRTNIAYCKARNIRLSGPKLGRPPQVKDPTLSKLERQDGKVRNAVEGKFGEGKRRYGLGLVMARLQETSETVIALQFLVMNLEQRLRNLFFLFFKELFLRRLGTSILVVT